MKNAHKKNTDTGHNWANGVLKRKPFESAQFSRLLVLRCMCLPRSYILRERSVRIGQWPLAIGNSNAVPPTSEKNIMAVDLLPHIADIDNSLGFIALCRYILSQKDNSTSDCRQLHANSARCDALLTLTLFLRYLEIKCLTIDRTCTLRGTLPELKIYLKNLATFIDYSVFYVCLMKLCAKGLWNECLLSVERHQIMQLIIWTNPSKFVQNVPCRTIMKHTWLIY